MFQSLLLMHGQRITTHGKHFSDTFNQKIERIMTFIIVLGQYDRRNRECSQQLKDIESTLSPDSDECKGFKLTLLY